MIPRPNPSVASVAVEPLPANVLTLWRLGAAIPGGLVLVVAVVVAASGSGLLVAAGGLALAVVLAPAGLLLAQLNYRRWRWGLDERWIEIRHGVIVRRVQIVPRSRVQTLTTRTGPLDRMLGLTTVVVHTAGTHTPNLVVPHIDTTAVARLQEELGR